MRILIAEHDKSMSRQLQRLLGAAGHETISVSNGTQALDDALRQSFDLLLLTVKLPDRTGISVTEELRQLHVETPILILSELSTSADKILGLDAGADDYMTKPFDSDELLARIRALTRRNAAAIPDVLEFGDAAFHAGTASLVCGDDCVRLNYKETALIKLLMTHHRQILSKDELIRRVWGYSAATSDNNVEAYISFLRKKLLTIGSRVSIIAIKKQGYQLHYEEN